MIRPDDYDYSLPEELIALEPASPRDSSRLFIYDTRHNTITFDYFYNLDKHLPATSFLVLNNTKVVPSRLWAKKENGGKVEVLFLVGEMAKNSIQCMFDRKVVVGQRLTIDQDKYITVIGQNKQIFEARFEFSKEELVAILEEKGRMPLPPYLKKTSLTENDLRSRYQTVFAQNRGSSAAPTASLHFTERVFSRLADKRIEKTYIDLHVGLGTFAPLTEDNIQNKRLHKEWYEISSKAVFEIEQRRAQNRQLVAVGTTVVRSLESSIKGSMYNKIKHVKGETDLFIFPPFQFHMVDILLTNFHVPKSSLMMLVDAFLQHKQAQKSILDLYKAAIEAKFRFFSFGDAMLIV